MRPPNWLVWVPVGVGVGGPVAVGSVGLMMVGASGGPAASGPVAQSGKVWTQDELRAAVTSRGAQEVTALLGRPDSMSSMPDPEEETWRYTPLRFKIVNPLTGRPSRCTAVLWFDHGRVTTVTLLPIA
jgi:hypothetical protein